jgi:hypothetical protein
MKKPHTEIKTIEPAWALAILEQQGQHAAKGNYKQRAISKAAVERFAAEMRAGNWTVTGQGLSFDCDGHLLDGQHRLQAVVKSGVAVDMLVMWDLPSQRQVNGRSVRTIDAIDSGRPRSLANQLQITGFKYTQTLAPALTSIIAVSLSHHSRSTPLPLGAFFKRPIARGIVMEVNRLYSNQIYKTIDLLQISGTSRGKQRGFNKGSLVGPLTLMRCTQSNYADDFIKHLRDRTNLKSGSPIIALMDVLEANSIARWGGGTGAAAGITSCTVSALWYWVHKKPINGSLRGNEEHLHWFRQLCQAHITRIRAICAAGMPTCAKIQDESPA